MRVPFDSKTGEESNRIDSLFAKRMGLAAADRNHFAKKTFIVFSHRNASV
ncbi:hypothetical protein J19TS2_57050 [Cohnella xylanilytica]|nr:hypothetical protein J19TS2_57050 [Cohnella xylanilytica]